MAVSWLYRLRKEELIIELEKHGCDIQGAVLVLRQRLVEYVRTHAEEFQDKPRDPDDYNEEADKTRDLDLDQKPALLQAQHRSELNAVPGGSTTNPQPVFSTTQPLNTRSAAVMTHAPNTESSTSTTVTPSNQYAIPRMSTPTSGPQVFVPSFIPEFSAITENR